jgi:ANTAR domain
MEREHLDPTAAFERLPAVARSSSRKVADVARDVLADVPAEQCDPFERHGVKPTDERVCR